MGKQWLLCKVAGDATAGDTKSGVKSRKRHGNRKMSSSTSSASSGCMGAIFHLFDIQQYHHFPFHHQPSNFINESTISSIHQEQPNNLIIKGVEAPRNSLELEEQEKEELTSSSSSSSTKKETNFNTPIRDIHQIKTKRTRLMDINNNDASSECSSSSPAGTKTPSLVARLMGLDLLPENNSSPRPSLSSLKSNNNTRSLPVTPRASTSTARASTEVDDYHHRLSLQVNKRRYDHESNTSEYAKQIAKQVRENISRRVGADITNTSKKKEHRRDEYLVVLKPKKPSSPSSANTFVEKSRNFDQGYGRGKENEPIPPSCSPRLKLLDIKKNNNLNKPISKSSPLSSSSSLTEVIKAPSSLPSTTSKSPPPPMMMKEEVVQVMIKQENNNPMKVQKCKKLASEKYDLRLKKLHQVRNEDIKTKCIKSTPLSNHLVNINRTTKFISSKKDIIESTSSTVASPQKQVTYESITQLPSCQSRSYKTINLSVQHDITTNGIGATTSYSDHISTILNHAGIKKTTPISITHWYSPSHPLHPSIFQKLNHPNQLIFDVVDELLVEILKPYISLKPWVVSLPTRQIMFGTQLIETLCDKISCFPEANCQVLEDIDGLIKRDMKRDTKDIAFEQEAEELVVEIERDMVDTLVGEMAAAWLYI